MGKIPNKALVVVATGTVAKLFEMERKSGDVSLRFDRELTPGNLADEGPAGKSPPDQTGAESMEATFSKILANKLFDMVHKGEAQKLILIADPDTLGEMRPLLHQEVNDALALQLDKTLINAPVEDIERSISAAFSID